MNWRPAAGALLREPLVHFLIAGALVFALLANRPPDPGERRIVVDEVIGVRLADRFMQSYRRAPSPDEVDALIRDHVKGEVYYREALRLGLDQGDEVVMRRMRNKMLALATADAEAREPGDAELQALIDQNPARYAGTARYDFEQVYFGQDSAENRFAVETAATGLTRGGATAGLGTSSPLPMRFSNTATTDIAAQFGDDFASGLGGLTTNQWTELSSGLGLHLVRVTRREAGAKPTVASIRQRLTNDWRAAARSKAEEANYRALLEGYDVVIAQPRK